MVVIYINPNQSFVRPPLAINAIQIHYDVVSLLMGLDESLSRTLILIISIVIIRLNFDELSV